MCPVTKHLQVIGMHLMNPPLIMKLVEIIRGAATSDETYNATKSLATPSQGWGIVRTVVWERLAELSDNLHLRSHIRVYVLEALQFILGRKGKVSTEQEDIILPWEEWDEWSSTATNTQLTAEHALPNQPEGSNTNEARDKPANGSTRAYRFIGLDVCVLILRVLHAGLGEFKFAPCLLVQYVDAGRCGRKSGVGIYDYRQASKSTKQAAS
ncbi:3-hydroxybutyryl-CoA dehydrogenase [Bienertia sinuspersici]